MIEERRKQYKTLRLFIKHEFDVVILMFSGILLVVKFFLENPLKDAVQVLAISGMFMYSAFQGTKYKNEKKLAQESVPHTTETDK